MAITGKAKILRIFLNETTKYEKGPLYDAIVKMAFEKGLAGSMVYQGLEGFGFCCKFCRRTHEGLSAPKCQPLVIEFIDTEEKLNELVPVLKTMLKSGAMLMQDANILFNEFEE